MRRGGRLRSGGLLPLAGIALGLRRRPALGPAFLYLLVLFLTLVAAFPLLETERGREALTRYYADYLSLAADCDAGFVLETPTWRANRDWGVQLGYSPDALRRVAHDAVAFARSTTEGWTGSSGVAVSGCVGPRGDGYEPASRMTASDAASYHVTQVRDLSDAGADLITAFTIPTLEEGVGIVAAAAEVGVPCVLGFTVETDGRLPTGMPLGEAIDQVDAATGSSAAWFMVNCAHPEHVLAGLPATDEAWLGRIGAYRANASRQSHAQLDEAEELDDGDPAELAQAYLAVAERLPSLRVLGGCCGTDVRHVSAVADAWRASR